MVAAATAILIAAIGQRMPRAGASRSEKLRLHGTATLKPAQQLRAATKLAFQRMFEISEFRRIAKKRGPPATTGARDQTYLRRVGEMERSESNN